MSGTTNSPRATQQVTPLSSAYAELEFAISECEDAANLLKSKLGPYMRPEYPPTEPSVHDECRPSSPKNAVIVFLEGKAESVRALTRHIQDLNDRIVS